MAGVRSRGMSFKERVGHPTPSFPHPSHEVQEFTLTHAPTTMFYLTTGPKTIGLIDHGLKLV